MTEVKEIEPNPPHGLEENVPNRSGIGHNNPYLQSNTLQDNKTEERRAHYGEDPAFEIKTGEDIPREPYDVNDVKTPNNPTRNEQIRRGYEETSFGRASTQ